MAYVLTMQPVPGGLGYRSVRRVAIDHRRIRRHGLAASTATQISSAGAGAASVAGALMSNLPTSGKIESSIGGALATAIPFSGPAAPFLAGAAAVMQLLTVMGVGSGCGQTCVLSSRYADQAESILRNNILTYFSLPAPRTSSQQAAALQIFDTVWNDLTTQCGNPSLGNAGRRCISDRDSGACVWKQTSSSVLLGIPGEPQPGECWNWKNGYRDPIAHDSVVSDGSSLLSSLFGGGGPGGSSWVPLAAIAALVVLGAVL